MTDLLSRLALNIGSVKKAGQQRSGKQAVAMDEPGIRPPVVIRATSTINSKRRADFARNRASAFRSQQMENGQ
jgi:hypothetical protein